MENGGANWRRQSKRKKVLGSTDNTDTMPDIDYEVSLFLANFGYAEIWNQICDEQ
jgi:hypothetical protein